MKDRTIVRVIAFFAAIAGIFAVVTIKAVRNINRSVATSDWVNHTHAVISEGEDLRSVLRAGESALRVYLIAGNPRDQAAARVAFGRAAEHLEVLSALTRSDAVAKTQLAALEPLVKDYLGRVEPLAARAADPAALQALDASAAAAGEIERRLQKFKSDEMTLLAEQDTASYLQAQATRWTVWSGLAVTMLLLGGVAWLIRDDLAARRRAAAVLEEANAQLEGKVRERTAELVAANEQLSTENLERQWANQALEHQLRYDRLIIDSMGDPVLVLTKVLNISRVNPAVVRTTGYEPTALINRPLSKIVRLARESGTSAPLVDPIAHALNTGHELRDAPAIMRNKQGGETPVRLTLCPLRDADKVVGGVAILEIALKT